MSSVRTADLDRDPADAVLDYLRSTPRGFALLGDLAQVVPAADEGVRELLEEQRVTVEDFHSIRDRHDRLLRRSLVRCPEAVRRP